MLSIENFSLILKGSDDRLLPVLEDVSLKLKHSECLGIAGESGSGKSVLALSLVGLFPKKAVHKSMGKIIFEGVDLLALSEKELQGVRGSRIGFIFQEPMTAMNPLMTLYDQVAEGIQSHESSLSRSEVAARVMNALTIAGFDDPEKFYASYPHQLSGGMRQRAMIAIGLAMEPDIIIADEPTTAIDAGIQVQLLKELRKYMTDSNRSMIFISHDLGVLRAISDDLAVLYAGILVEYGKTDEIMEQPRHPYSRDLVAALPRLVAERILPKPIRGNLPAPDQKPLGCVYSDRCNRRADKCLSSRPGLTEVAEGRFVRCFFPLKLEGEND